MKTILEKLDNKDSFEEKIKAAARIIREGGLVAFPTETVYGLGADALNPQASRKIYEAKGRPSDNPLIVHIEKMEDLQKIVTFVPDAARRMAERFWPGPLTMIFENNGSVPHETTGGLATVAVRMPSHPAAQALIRESMGFIAAPSANTSGKPSPTMAEHVLLDLEGKIPMILDGGPVGIGIESTILDFSEGLPVVLRPGYITVEMIRDTIGCVDMDPGLSGGQEAKHPKAPGMKYRHYAPKAELLLIQGEQGKVTEKINGLAAEACRQGRVPGIIATEESVEAYTRGIVKCIGSRNSQETVAKHLYGILREFDDMNVDIIYSESFSDTGIGQAVMNRMIKAAGHRILEV